MNSDNLTRVLALFLRKLKNRQPTKKILGELIIHPDYPSLSALSDVLTGFNVANASFVADETRLPSMPLPFIAHSSETSSDFVVVTNIKDGYLYFSNEKHNNRSIPVNDFFEKFTGVVLIGEYKGTVSRGRNLAAAIIDYRNTLALAFLGVLTLLAIYLNTTYFSELHWQKVSLTLVKSAGLVTSIFLLTYSYNVNNPLLRKLCPKGVKVDCGSVQREHSSQRVRLKNVCRPSECQAKCQDTHNSGNSQLIQY